MVRLDPLYFKTAMSHILLNAVKYTPKDGHVLVFTEKKDGRFIIRIEDDGPGIAESMKERVFEPFFRSMDDVNRKTPGAGLGLTIARGIFSGMNGIISIKDKISGKTGCSVCIVFPVGGPHVE